MFGVQNRLYKHGRKVAMNMSQNEKGIYLEGF